MNMEKYSCWSGYCSKRYYLTHPWKWFKDLGRFVKDVCMRARYGFTWSDVWNWDHWFLHTTPNMLRHMALHGSAFPGHPPFDTPERWHDWLNEIADLIETGTEDWQDAHNEYHDEYIEYIHKYYSVEKWKDDDGNIHSLHNTQPEISKKYHARAQELYKQGEANVRRAMTALGEHLYDVWD